MKGEATSEGWTMETGFNGQGSVPDNWPRFIKAVKSFISLSVEREVETMSFLNNTEHMVHKYMFVRL